MRNIVTLLLITLTVNTFAQSGNQGNQIVIGYNTTGNGSNSVTIGNSSIVDNYFHGYVRSTNAYVNSSDIRLKHIVPNTFNVSNLETISYKWKDKKEDLVHIGYSAQEVQKVLPDAVHTDKDGMLSVSYTEVLVAKVSMLEKENKAMKEEFSKLKLLVEGLMQK